MAIKYAGGNEPSSPFLHQLSSLRMASCTSITILSAPKPTRSRISGSAGRRPPPIAQRVTYPFDSTSHSLEVQLSSGKARNLFQKDLRFVFGFDPNAANCTPAGYKAEVNGSTRFDKYSAASLRMTVTLMNPVKLVFSITSPNRWLSSCALERNCIAAHLI